MNLKAFVIKYTEDYSKFGYGKYGRQRKRNKRLGKRKTRTRLNRELKLFN
jgi:hypothetical protein